MNKVFPAFFSFLSLLMMESCSTTKTPHVFDKIVHSKTVNLFNGKNLNGWYTFLQHGGVVMI